MANGLLIHLHNGLGQWHARRMTTLRCEPSWDHKETAQICYCWLSACRNTRHVPFPVTCMPQIRYAEDTGTFSFRVTPPGLSTNTRRRHSGFQLLHLTFRPVKVRSVSTHHATISLLRCLRSDSSHVRPFCFTVLDFLAWLCWVLVCLAPTFGSRRFSSDPCHCLQVGQAHTRISKLTVRWPSS